MHILFILARITSELYTLHIFILLYTFFYNLVFTFLTDLHLFILFMKGMVSRSYYSLKLIVLQNIQT